MLNAYLSKASFEMESAVYGVDKTLLNTEKSMFVSSTSGSSGDQCSPTLIAVGCRQSYGRKALDALLPVLYDINTD